MERNNILLEAALKYVERGWFVFPTREVASEPFEDKNGKIRVMKEKTPYIKGGFQAATTDKEQIEKWWKIYPNAGIGISCGHSNLVVVDIDVKEGRQGINNFMALSVSDEGALHGLTPSGGMHIIYGGQTDSHANVRAGLDLRSRGAYIVAPPSKIYKNNKPFGYVALDDWNRTPVEVPHDLIKKLNLLINKNEPKSEGKREFIITDDHATLVKKSRKALENLPSNYCEDYFLWINTGLALSSLGDDGFVLWDEWSRKSSKYDADACKYRWERFYPRDITIASLFYWAYKDGK